MHRPDFQIFNSKNSEEAEIYLYGTIGRYWRVDTEKIIQKIEQLKAEGLKRITFFVNSNGGEVPQGILLYNYLFRNSFEVTFIVDGVAASMMALLLMLPDAKVKMAKISRIMIHTVSGCACGKIQQIRDQADEMESWQKDLIGIVATRTGKSEKEVTSKWFDDRDHWINSSDALALKLIDEVIEGKQGVKAVMNVDDAFGVMQHYENQLINLNDEDTMKLTNEFANTLGLTGTQSEESILEAVRKMSGELTTANQKVKDQETEITSLKEKVSSHDKEKVTSLIDTAIAEKKIGEDMRETYTNLAEKDFEGTKKALESMSGVGKVKNNLEQGSGNQAHKDWTFQDFQEKDGAALAAMKENDPERYKALYKAAFGKEPAGM